jgi:hypothetical protein
MIASATVDFRISALSIRTLLKTLEAAAAHPHSGPPALARFAGIGGSTTRKSLAALTAIGLITREQSGGYVCTDPKIQRGVDDSSARQVIRHALIRYRPFEAICEGLALGESVGEAIRKGEVLLGLDATETPKFELLVKWGTELSLLHELNGRVVLSPEIVPTAAAIAAFITAEDVESEAKARLFVASRMGRDAYNGIEEKDRALLAGSLLEVGRNPADSVEKAGQAVENYLREFCENKGFGAEAAKRNGGSQLANLLAEKNLIHSHQQKLVDSVSMLRNAKAHHKDKKTLVPWTIDEDGALASFFSAITALKSIHAYTNHGTQLL